MAKIQSYFWDDKTKEIFINIINNPILDNETRKKAKELMLSMDDITKNDIRLKKIKKLIDNVKKEIKD